MGQWWKNIFGNFIVGFWSGWMWPCECARRALRMVGSRGRGVDVGFFVFDVRARVAHADLAMDAAQGLPLLQLDSNTTSIPATLSLRNVAQSLCTFRGASRFVRWF